MKILDFVKNLAPMFKKRDLVDQLRVSLAELRETTIPAYKDVTQDFAAWKFTSSEVNRIIPTFNQIVKKRKGNLLVSITATLENMSVIGDKLMPTLEKEFEETMVGQALTYSQAQRLQLVQAIDFTNRYARKLVNYIIVAETAKYDLGNTIEKRLTKAQKLEVETYFTNFCMLLNAFNSSPADILALFDRVPNILVTPENHLNVEATMGRVKLDPLNFNFISASWNPFYLIGLLRNSWQAARYEEAKADLEMIRLRILNLKALHGGNPDPVIQREIEYNEERVQKLEAKIADMER